MSKGGCVDSNTTQSQTTIQKNCWLIWKSTDQEYYPYFRSDHSEVYYRIRAKISGRDIGHLLISNLYSQHERRTDRMTILPIYSIKLMTSEFFL